MVGILEIFHPQDAPGGTASVRSSESSDRIFCPLDVTAVRPTLRPRGAYFLDNERVRSTPYLVPCSSRRCHIAVLNVPSVVIGVLRLSAQSALGMLGMVSLLRGISF